MILIIDGVNKRVLSIECNALKERKISIFNIVDKHTIVVVCGLHYIILY